MAMMTRREPFGGAMSLRDAMDQLMRDSFVVPFGRLGQTIGMPVDVYETDAAFVVKASMPGLTADQLNISVEQQTVTIHGEPKVEERDGMRPLLQERRVAAFTRTFALPVPVDASKAQAELVNGVLSLTLPKSEASKPRKIQIRSS
jgi:HSP20 family protein